MSAAFRAAMLALAATLAACAAPSYDERIWPAHAAFYGGDPAAAAQDLALALERADEADKHLLWLERGMALQAQGRFAQAAELLVRGDDALEVLDYSSAPLSELSDSLFSLGVSTWRATPPEKVLVNTQNMINFLGAGDVSEAAVEARRVRLLLLQEDLPPEDRYDNPLAWALAGLIFEHAGRPGEAADAFREAGATGLEQQGGPGEGTILLVVQAGRTPVRVEAVYQLWLGGTLRRLQIPALVQRPGPSGPVRASLDGGPERTAPLLLDIEGQAIQRYEQEFPRLLAAALLQMLPRAVLSDALRREAASDGDSAARSLLVELAATLFEQWLGERFPADTRCWSLLPAGVHALRFNVPPGEHDLVVRPRIGARSEQHVVQVRAGDVVLVNVVTALGQGLAASEPPLARDVTGTQTGLAVVEHLLAESQFWRHHAD